MPNLIRLGELSAGGGIVFKGSEAEKKVENKFRRVRPVFIVSSPEKDLGSNTFPEFPISLYDGLEVRDEFRGKTDLVDVKVRDTKGYNGMYVAHIGWGGRLFVFEIDAGEVIDGYRTVQVASAIPVHFDINLELAAARNFVTAYRQMESGEELTPWIECVRRGRLGQWLGYKPNLPENEDIYHMSVSRDRLIEAVTSLRPREDLLNNPLPKKGRVLVVHAENYDRHPQVIADSNSFGLENAIISQIILETQKLTGKRLVTD